jgi:Domain of unknown function (DUF4214)
LAIGNDGTGNFLYATDFHNNQIDVFNSSFQQTALAGNFTDPNLPAGFAPFNIAVLNGKIYVTYAMQDAEKHDDVAGPGNGFTDTFSLDGVFQSRLVSNGSLNSPWGLALAPANFGALSGDLLVGNFGDGKINAFDPNTGASLGTLNGPNGQPITIDSLWGLTFGNGVTAGSTNTLYFTAGVGSESEGLFGSLSVNTQNPLTGNGSNVVATRGQVFTGVVGTFTALDGTATSGEFSATINWGDGTTSPGTVAVNNNGGFEVMGTHTYATAGIDSISVMVTGVATSANPSGSSVTIASQAQVHDAALMLTSVPVSVGASLTATNVTVGTFNDAGGAQAVGSYTATINWGDGRAATTGMVSANSSGSASQFTISGSHTYATPGHYTITIDLADQGGSTASATASAVIGTQNQLFLVKAYQDLLGRGIDPSALAFFTAELNNGVSTSAVALSITSAQEFHTDEVVSAFNHFLHRVPDAGGLANGVNMLAGGGTVEQLDVQIVSSAEYFQLHNSTNDAFVKALYQDVLGRSADSGGEAFFDQALAGGEPRSQVADILFGSAEYRQTLVTGFYAEFLHRAPDPGGLNLFVNELAAGTHDEAVISAVVGSSEYLNNV